MQVCDYRLVTASSGLGALAPAGATSTVVLSHLRRGQLKSGRMRRGGGLTEAIEFFWIFSENAAAQRRIGNPVEQKIGKRAVVRHRDRPFRRYMRPVGAS